MQHDQRLDPVAYSGVSSLVESLVQAHPPLDQEPRSGGFHQVGEVRRRRDDDDVWNGLPGDAQHASQQVGGQLAALIR